MKNFILIVFVSGLLLACGGFETESVVSYDSPRGDHSEGDLGEEDPPIIPEDPAVPETPDPTPTEPEPFRCVKSKFHEPDFSSRAMSLPKACRKATKKQIARVNRGNKKFEAFLAKCYEETGDSCWCDQLTRPNPRSINTFRCTYGDKQPHRLVHPSKKTWKFAIEAAKIILELEKKGLGVKIIYNWWRPEPYNKNVGGSAGRHPFGTSIDVRFVSNSVANKAFYELCKMRKAKRIRAIGHYGSSALHFGVGDHNGNTWGKSCP